MIVLDCLPGVYLGIWIRRTACEVKERGELGRRGSQAVGIVAVGFIEVGSFGGDFFTGMVEVTVIVVAIVLEAIVVSLWWGAGMNFFFCWGIRLFTKSFGFPHYLCVF